MREKKTAKQLTEEANRLERDINAMDEHSARAFLDDTMTPEEREIHRRSRNKLAALARKKRDQAKERA